ncbi:MAG: glycosyltransferase [Trichlorobacter sp.]|nr:glycosyltransferase [Trichlorobacter sp.]
MPRIMIIHPEGNINNNPNLTGIVEILCEKGHTVDIYSPRVAHMQQCAPCSGANLILADAKPVSRPDFLAVFPFESVESPESISDYINCNVPDYDLIIGVDRGIIEAAIVARKQKVPYGLISYEILFSEETGLEYTLADRGAARGASFAVCQDRVRSFHLSREIGIPLECIIDIPVSGRAVKHGARNYILHEKLGFSKETKIALYIGGITYKWSGIDELIAGTDRWSDDWVLVLHHRYSTYDQAFIDKISCKQKQNVFLSPFPSIPFDQLHTLLNAADVGLSFYIPQFQRNGFTDRNNLKYIGMSSGKTSTYIQHGLPVIINEIGQMSDFVRNYNLGKVITDFSDLGFHLERIDNKDLSNFSNNCYKFFKTHLDLDVTIQPLLNIIFSLLDRKTIMETINKANNHMVVKKPIDSFETQGKVPDLMYEFGLDAPSSGIDVKNVPEPQQSKHVATATCGIEIDYFQPPAGSTESFIDVRPFAVQPTTHSTFQGLKDYSIRDFGEGLDAARQIIQHIFDNKLHTPLTWRDDIWFRTVVVRLTCNLMDRRTGRGMDELDETETARFGRDFLAVEGAERVSDILSYRERVLQGADLGQPLYVSGAVLNSLGGVVEPHAIYMIDGARRIAATALASKGTIDISLIILEEEYAGNILEVSRQDALLREVGQLAWFNNYQSIPLVGIAGERTLTRFSLMDMTLLRDQVIMDFGCNLGQACIKGIMAGAREVWGVEGMPDTWRIASEIGRLSNFPNLHYLNIDFNEPDFDRQIDAACPGQVDYTFFFSVYRTKELTQRDRLFRYIIDKTRKGIFFEGHADPVIDTVNYYDWLFETFGVRGQFLGNSEDTLRPLFFIPCNRHQAVSPPSPTKPAVTNGPALCAPELFRVSAIVSTYKSERFIEGRLKDLLDQTLGEQLEIIVIDSSSPENERAIVERYAASHPNIVYIRTDQRETVYQAWNRGARIARGTYLTNANTDDRLRPDALEILARELDTRPEVALVYADFFITGYENMTFNRNIRTGYSIKPEYAPNIMLHGCHMGPQPMWRRSLHDEIGYFDETLVAAGDYEFWCRIACRYPMYHVPLFLGLYLHNPKGICNSNIDLCTNESQQVRERYRNLLPPPRSGLPSGCYYREKAETGKFVNIGMVTYNRLEFTRQAIAALVGYTDFPYVLTVIDNNSSDGTREYLSQLKQSGVIHNLILLDENVGVAKASNLAWSLEPNADYYLKLDNDIVIQKMGWLTGLVRTIDAIPQLGAVAYNFEPASYPLHEVRGVRIRPKNGNLGGACVLIPRRTHEKLGYWCEDYGLYGEEDGDYGLRIQFAGLLNAYMEDEEIGLHLPAGRAAVIDPKTFVASDGREELEHTEYRQWKDAQRRKNIIGGTLSRNLERYRNDRTSLFIASPFAAGWLAPHSKYVTKHAETAADASTFKKVSDKIKVSVFSLDAKVDACGYYRIQAPLEKLVPEIEVSWEGIEFWDGQYHIAPGKVDTADIIVVQRFFPRPETAHFLEFLCSLDKPVIFEIDDLLTQIPASNPSYGLGVISTPHIYELVRKCAAVTVSTPELKSHFSSYSNNVYVLPNLLDSDLWETPSPPSFGPIVIGYAGGKTHATDISLLEEVLEAIAGKYPGKVVFTFMGCATERLSRLPGFVFIPFNATYEAYARKMQQTPMDIALVPLEDNPFNRCKSNIKWLEYSACGFAGIYADLRPYSDCIEHGQTGLLVGPEPDQWYRAIELLIEHPELRHSIASNARQKVLSTYTLKTGAHCWLEVYHEVLARHKAGIPVPTGSFR